MECLRLSRRHVFDTKEVALVWARQSQDTGRNSNNTFYFNGGTIYSYGSHFPIARFVDGCVLFTTCTSSKTTSRHIGFVQDALKIVTCPIYYVDTVVASSHANNFKCCRSDLALVLLKMKRARTLKAKYKDQAERIIENANSYARWFGLRSRLKMPV